MYIAGYKNDDETPLVDEHNAALFESIDMNKDGKITVLDVTTLQVYISENI